MNGDVLHQGCWRLPSTTHNYTYSVGGQANNSVLSALRHYVFHGKTTECRKMYESHYSVFDVKKVC